MEMNGYTSSESIEGAGRPDDGKCIEPRPPLETTSALRVDFEIVVWISIRCVRRRPSTVWCGIKAERIIMFNAFGSIVRAPLGTLKMSRKKKLEEKEIRNSHLICSHSGREISFGIQHKALGTLCRSGPVSKIGRSPEIGKLESDQWRIIMKQ